MTSLDRSEHLAKVETVFTDIIKYKSINMPPYRREKLIEAIRREFNAARLIEGPGASLDEMFGGTHLSETPHEAQDTIHKLTRTSATGIERIASEDVDKFFDRLRDIAESLPEVQKFVIDCI